MKTPRLQSYILMVTCILLSLGRVALSQQARAPEVVVTGVLLGAGDRDAIVRSANGAWIVHQGGRLGNYRVLKIDQNQVVFGYGASTFPVAIAGRARTLPEPVLRLQGASLLYAARLVCGASHQQMQVAPDLSGTVTLHRPYQASQALDQILKGTAFGWTEHRGVAIVARRSRLKAVVANFEHNLTALRQAPVRPVSMSLVEARLQYVCEICAREMHLGLSGPPPRGQVTCLAMDRPAAQILALACALQPTPVTVSLKDKTLQFH